MPSPRTPLGSTGPSTRHRPRPSRPARPGYGRAARARRTCPSRARAAAPAAPCRSARTARPARRPHRRGPRRRWCGRRAARSRRAPAGAPERPCSVVAATECTGRRNSGWWVNSRSAPQSSASSTTAAVGSTASMTRRTGRRRVAAHRPGRVPGLGGRRRVPGLQQADDVGQGRAHTTNLPSARGRAERLGTRASRGSSARPTTRLPPRSRAAAQALGRAAAAGRRDRQSCRRARRAHRAAALASTCASLDAPGIATTRGWLTR